MCPLPETLDPAQQGTMAAKITIQEANQSDLLDMIAICCESMDSDLIKVFLYGRNPVEAVERYSKSLTASLGARFTKPTNRCYIFKAVDQDTDKLIGWILVKWEDSGLYVLPTDSADGKDFSTYFRRQIRQAWNQLLDGKVHVAIGALYVTPSCHPNGVGRRLVEYVYAKYQLDRELVIAQTGPHAEEFYQRLGWITAGSMDIDLSDWSSKGIGYGLHRSPQMIRYPQTRN